MANGPWYPQRPLLLIAAGLAALVAVILFASSAFDRSSPDPEIYWGAWISGEVFARDGEAPPPDAPWSERTWNQFVADAGKEVSIVHFGQPAPWNEPFDPEPFERIAARGAIPLLDMDPDGVSLAQIAAGAEDWSFEAWAAAARRYEMPFFFRWAWEMNGTWFQWGEEAAADPALYVSAWRHLHDLLAAAGASNVTWVWCPHEISAETTPLPSLYPGDAYVDWTCMDGYNPADHSSDVGSKSFREIFGPTYDELLALAPDKPVMIGETASSEVSVPPSKPEWIADALGSELPDLFPQVKAFVWFNWNIREFPDKPRLRWPIESSPASQAAFAAAISSSYYAPAGEIPSLPPLAPIQPLP
jgi:hypothetical protein